MYRSVLLLELQTNRPNSDAGFYSLTSKRSDKEKYSPDHDLDGGLLRSQTLSDSLSHQNQPQLKSPLNGYHNNSNSMSSETVSPVIKKHVTFKMDNNMQFPCERKDILPDYFGDRPRKEILKPQIKQPKQDIPSCRTAQGSTDKPSGPITSARVRYSRERNAITSEPKSPSPIVGTRQKLPQEPSNNHRNERSNDSADGNGAVSSLSNNRPWTPLARISESASTIPFEIRKNRVPISKLRALANERSSSRTPLNFKSLKSTYQQEEQLPQIETVRAGKNPSPQLLNYDTRNDSRNSNNQDEQQKALTLSTQKVNTSTSIRPPIPLRVVTPTFEDAAVSIPRRSKTSLGASMKPFQDEKPLIEPGIESRPRSRNYSFANRPVINGRTQVFLTKSASSRLASAPLKPRIRRSSANLEQLVSSCVNTSRQHHQSNDETPYGSTTELDAVADTPKSKTKELLLPKMKFNGSVDINNDNIIQSVISNKQSRSSSKMLAVELKYIVLQEKIANCSPLIPSEENMVNFFLQRGSQKYHTNRDKSNCLFFSYQVRQFLNFNFV